MHVLIYNFDFISDSVSRIFHNMTSLENMTALLKRISSCIQPEADVELVNQEPPISDQQALLIPSSNKPEISFGKQLLACAVVMVSVVVTSISFACVQILGGAVPEFELNTWRFGVQIFIMVPINMFRKWDLKVPKSKLPLMILNIILMNALNVLLFTAVIYIPVGVMDGLYNAIIIWVNALLSICFKSGRKPALYFGAALCTVGIVLILQPRLLFSTAHLPPPPQVNWTSTCVQLVNNVELSNSSYDHTKDNNISQLHDTSLGYMFLISAAMCSLILYHSVSVLVEDVSPFTLVFWNALVGTAVSSLLMGIFEQPTLLRSWFCIGMLLIHCVGTTMYSLILPWSLQYLSPTLSALLSSCRLVILVLLQYTIMRDIKPGLQNWVEIFGACVCFIGVIGGPLWLIVQEPLALK